MCAFFGPNTTNFFKQNQSNITILTLVLFQPLLDVSIHVRIIMRQFLKYVAYFLIVLIWILICIIFKIR
jgi:hypothetical protein